MVDASLKFGPEWLRAITEPQGTAHYSPPPMATMKLADYRYGREEMLALFDKNVVPPNVDSLGNLYLDKCRLPLNLMQMGAEETQVWQKGANSDASLRGGASMKRSQSPVRGGRGGRGRGYGSYPSYERTIGLDDDFEVVGGRSKEDRGSARGGMRAAFLDTSRDKPHDPSSRDDEWDPSIPKKGYTKAPSEDWRAARWEGSKPRDDGWRTGLSANSWRNERSSATDHPAAKPGAAGVEPPSPHNRQFKKRENLPPSRDQLQVGGSGGGETKLRSWENVPEWANNSLSENREGGFDDMGKFKSVSGAERKTASPTDFEIPFSEEKTDNFKNQTRPETQSQQLSQQQKQQQLQQQQQQQQQQLQQPKQQQPETAPTETRTEIRPDKVVNNNAKVEPPAGFSTDDITWTYLDPQGNVQGPFKSDEMLEWCTAGYFPHDLMVKRSLDTIFTPLAELSKIYGRNPFTPGPMAPPRNSDHDEHIKQRQMIQLHQLLLAQQHQQQLIAQQQQQLLLQQQQQQQQSVAASLPNHLGASLPPLANNSIFDMGGGGLNLSPEVSNIGPPSDAFAKLLSGQKLATEKPDTERAGGSVAVDPISSLLEQLKVREREDKQKQQLAEQQKQLAEQQKQLAEQQQKQLQLQEQQKQQHMAEQQKQLQLQEQQKLLQEAQKLKEQHQLKERMLREQQQKLREQQELQAVADQIIEDEPEYNPAAAAPRREESTPPVSSDFGEAAATQGSSSSDPSGFKEEISPEEASTFQVPKSSEKRKGKNKKLEEKKKASRQAAVSEKPYIPGMPGSVPPPEVEPETNAEEPETASYETEKVPAKVVESPVRERPPVQEIVPPKLAPWAKKAPERAPASQGPTLQEIQRMEAERDRMERAARERAEAQARAERRRFEEEQASLKQTNWSAVIAPTAQAKSLSEIQAEEAGKAARLSKAAGSKLKTGGKTKGGKESQPSSWAGKTGAIIPVQQPAPMDGFWDHSISDPDPKPTRKNPPAAAMTAAKTCKPQQQQESPTKRFEDWCVRSLESFNAQVDVPTFLAFLRDIESPYEVNDYIRSYIGDGKAQKRFGADYLEKRSAWKNAMKKKSSSAVDDLTTPAAAKTPGAGEFQEAVRKGKKKGKGGNSKTNLNHLLGFSVQAGKGVNRGELDTV